MIHVHGFIFRAIEPQRLGLSSVRFAGPNPISGHGVLYDGAARRLPASCVNVLDAGICAKVSLLLAVCDGLRIPRPTREADHFVEAVKREGSD
jgi:hypothetical protein